MDDFCRSVDSVVTWDGNFVHDGWLSSHSSGYRHRRRTDSADTGQETGFIGGTR